MILQGVLLSVLICSAYSFTLQASPEKYDESFDRTTDADADADVDADVAGLSVSELLERANVNVGKNPEEPRVEFGDIAVPRELQNADQCTQRRRGCLWPKARDGLVYVPYQISRQYSPRERSRIVEGLRSFAASTCIRFTPRNGQRDFVDIKSLSGCFSFIGRRGNGQDVSLNRQGCVFKQIIQHEMLHALGFHHEQNRSDRDLHVRILFQNVMQGLESNFNKVNTVNLGTPYDYNSVMQYGRFAFSRNGQPTIVPIPNNNVSIGRAQQMSSNDIARVNRLYRCNQFAPRAHMRAKNSNRTMWK